MLDHLNLTQFEALALWGVLLVAILGLLYALFLRRQVLAEEKGTPKMIEVWEAIKSGADAYLQKQLRTILPFIAILTVALFFSVYIVPPSAESIERFPGTTPDELRMMIGVGRAIAFIMGAGFSLAVGQIGMRMAVQGNVRVANAARRSFPDALRIAYRTGTITGMLTDGLGLLGGTIIFMYYGIAAPDALLGFGFGGTLVALFMRVGGGIFTKAADVGADLVGKVEQDIPEDDPRNAAVIADLVGDNVGDCAGMAADIFESYEVTIVSALILGLALVAMTGDINWIIYPLLVRGIGVLSSIIGTYMVKGQGSDSSTAMNAIFSGFLTSAAISVVLFGLVAFFYMQDVPGGWWRPFLSTAAGVLLAIVLDRMTDWFAGTHGAPVKEINKATGGGPATTILAGLGVGYEATVWSAIVIALTILASVFIYMGVDVDPVTQTAFVLYGVALTGIGMLTLTGNNVAMDSFGPISDNANGIGEMAGLEPKARQIMADLDGVGNTTKAITKGIAIATAVLAATALFGAYNDAVLHGRAAMDAGTVSGAIVQAMSDYSITAPMTLVGAILGASTVFLFAYFCIDSVTRTAGTIVFEVRRQFREIPGIMEGTARPEYGKVVDICTAASLRELAMPGLLAVSAPIAVGLGLGVGPLAGFLAGTIATGVLMAVLLANSGGAWDNAKKIVEDGNFGGKGSKAHEASITGDTVGDPFKDTAGPAINPLIKVMNLVSVLIAPVVIVLSEAEGASPVLRIALACVAGTVAMGAILGSRRRAKMYADSELAQV